MSADAAQRMALDLVAHHGSGVSAAAHANLSTSALRRLREGSDVVPEVATVEKLWRAWRRLPPSSQTPEPVARTPEPPEPFHVHVVHESAAGRVTRTADGGYLVAGPVVAVADPFADEPGATTDGRLALTAIPASVDPACLAAVLDDLFERRDQP